MKLSRLLLPLALSLSLMGCQTIAAGLAAGTSVVTGQSVAQVAPVTVKDAEKGLIVAHLALNFVGQQLIEQAQPGGLLHGEAALTAKHYYDVADDALRAADKADEAANAQGIVTAVSKANDALAQFNSILHP